MNSSLSIPTDNPYKLMAIVGAVIFIFGFYFLWTQNYKYNEIVFTAAERISMIEASDLTDALKKKRAAIENRKIEIVKKDREWLPYTCGVVSAIGILLCIFGFNRWLTKIYPVEEALQKEQLRNIRLTNKQVSKACYKKRT